MKLHHLRRRSRDSRGLTVLEGCVLLTVIAILIALAIPMSTGGGSPLEMAARNSSVQNAKGLGNVLSAYAADNDHSYPDGPTSTAIFNLLLSAKYLPNGDSAYIVDSPGKVKPPAGPGPLTAANVCWDMMGLATLPAGPAGISTSSDNLMPLLFNTGNAAGLHFPVPGGLGKPFELTLGPNNAFGSNGVIVLYKSLGAKFVKADPAHPGKTLGFMSKDYADPTPYVVRTP